jgi:hypothetical protein
MNPEYPFQPQQQPQPAQPQQQPNQSYVVPGAQPQQVPQPGYTPIPPANLPPIRSKPSKLWFILSIVFIVTTLAGLGVAIWAYMNYMDQKNNVDSKITSAVAKAEKEQADKLAADFAEAEKEPNRLFVGPDDYGRLSFNYPKTWSVYEAKDATKGGTYEAYFNPGVVPPVANDQQYALHVTIEDKDYDQVVATYEKLVKKGDLKSSSVKADEQNGTRLDGSFTKDIKGQAVIFKIRDKTVTIRSDAGTFKKDFDALIKTITFNK